ncbi:TonB-dependent receptor [Telmatospirillum siberiense]|nr:TonB-dependent receptor [Telmatospirillum siberiense]
MIFKVLPPQRPRLGARPVLSGFVLAAALLSTPAVAQTAATTAPSSETAGDAENKDAVEEVVVTARHRTEKAQDVPIPMTVLSGASLEAEGIHSVQELQQKLPSTNIIVNSPRMSSYAIRGIGASTIANEGLESATGLYVDGVYLGKTGMAISDLNDIDQVEVLRGPQGTLFGKNTTTGAFNFTTRKPTFTPEASAEITGGSYGDAEFRGAASGPISEDVLAGRLSVYRTEHEGYLDDPATGKHPNRRLREGVRTQLLGEPNDDLTLRLIAEYHRDNYPLGYAPTLYSLPPNATLYSKLAAMRAAGYNALPISSDPYSFSTTATHAGQDTNQRAISLQADWQLGKGYQLTSISAYRYWDFSPHNDSDFMNLNVITCCGMGDRDEQVTQEIRLASPKGEVVESTYGLYYFRQTQRAYIDSVYGNDPTLISIWLGVSQSVAARYYAGRETRIDSNLSTDSYAGFTQHDWHATDRLTLTAGVRETFEAKSIDLTRNLGGTSATLLDVQSVSKDLSAWSLGTNLAANYKLYDNFNLYSSYARGEKSGTLSNSPASGVALNADQLVVKPEKANDVEVGFKSQLLDRQVQFNGNLFYALIHDYQTNVTSIDPTTGVAGWRLANAPWLRSQGAELEANAQVTKKLKIALTGAYNDAEFRSFHSAPCPTEVSNASTKVCDYTGKSPMGVSRWNGNVSGYYTEHLRDDVDGYINASYTYRSGYAGSIDLSQYGHISGYGITNLTVGTKLNDGKVDLSLWARNLFNTHYYSAMGLTVAGAWFGYVGDPLTVGATARIHF